MESISFEIRASRSDGAGDWAYAEDEMTTIKSAHRHGWTIRICSSVTVIFSPAEEGR
jgi:hypothetical protein